MQNNNNSTSQAIELPEHLKGPARILRKTCQAEINVSDGKV